MIREYFCRPRENLRCFYITKDNVEEFINKYGYKGECTITITEYFAHAKYKHKSWYVRLNVFMVYEDDGWSSYTKEEFEEIYEIIL